MNTRKINIRAARSGPVVEKKERARAKKFMDEVAERGHGATRSAYARELAERRATACFCPMTDLAPLREQAEEYVYRKVVLSLRVFGTDVATATDIAGTATQVTTRTMANYSGSYDSYEAFLDDAAREARREANRMVRERRNVR